MLKLDGKELANRLYAKLENIPNKEKYKLIILTVGDDEASKVYVKNKIKACEKVGIACENINLDDSMNQMEFSQYVETLIDDEFYDNDSPYDSGGIILQLPAPKHYQRAFNDIIPPRLDVDGFGEFNQLMLVQGEIPPNYPATPKGIITILEENNIAIEGKHVVIVGRSEIVGKPLALMMLNKNATVTICHSKSENLASITRMADILVVAVGKPKFINDTHVKDGVVVVDVGINRLKDGTICGDVDYDRMRIKCAAITPVPGGVGPMTVYSLIENILNN